jgi:ABC-type glycerol-3-phosphate transport system substrate-binding protein
MLDKNNKLIFNSPQGVQALTALCDLLNKHKVMDPGSLEYGNPAARQVFNAGRASQIFMWPSQWTEANNPAKAAADVVGNVGISTIPAYNKSITGSATINAPEGYAVTRAAEKRGLVDEAVKLLQYLTTADVQIQDFKLRGRLPVLQSCFVDPALANDAKFGPVVKVALQQSPYPNFRFASEYQAKIVDALMPELFNALKGKKTPKEALDAAAALAAQSIPSK